MNASVKSIKSGASKGTATGKIAALGESEIGSAEVTLNPKVSVPQLESEAQQQPEQMAEQQDEWRVINYFNLNKNTLIRSRLLISFYNYIEHGKLPDQRQLVGKVWFVNISCAACY